MQDRPTVAPVKRMTLRQAVKDGMTLRPHAEHVYTCPPWCDGDDKDHEHPCLCDTSEIRWNRRFNHARPFASHERGQTFRVPVPA